MLVIITLTRQYTNIIFFILQGDSSIRSTNAIGFFFKYF